VRGSEGVFHLQRGVHSFVLIAVKFKLSVFRLSAILLSYFRQIHLKSILLSHSLPSAVSMLESWNIYYELVPNKGTHVHIGFASSASRHDPLPASSI
jgi:hypothetical protein